MRRLAFLLALFLMALPALGQTYELQVPKVVLRGVPFDVTVKNTDGQFNADSVQAYRVQVGDTAYPLTFTDGQTLVAEDVTGTGEVLLVQGSTTLAQGTARSVPGWLSILPPVLAILIALAFKRVIPALFLGIWIGAWIVVGGGMGWFYGLFDAFQGFIRTAMTDPDRVSIILFTLMIGGMVGIISKSGGTQGVVNKIIGWASSPRRGQVATGTLGLAIFFDDYANTLVVGNTMRPVTDRLRISREKLAYIVDSTAAPVACLALVTTWIGYEVGIIGAAVGQIEGFDEAAYSIFLNSIPYSFYPLLAIFFVFAVALT
ncbi:MAG TPA: Na+/H+ antiporter NhaC family protein, partial [Rhodothermales bacterium]|nr:Na+/H+ antiporter NhaC family protein [Rhodothermales bacterium]